MEVVHRTRQNYVIGINNGKPKSELKNGQHR